MNVNVLKPRQHAHGCPCSIPHSTCRCRAPSQRQSRLHSARCEVFCHQGQQGKRKGPLGSLRDQAASALKSSQTAAAALGLSALLLSGSALARWEGVNKPELLPKGEFSTVIDVAGFLTSGEEERLKSELASLERDKGVKLRVLAQNYPATPGLAVKDYWSVDDMTVVFVADPNTGNLLNFNVGSGVDLLVPRNFWSRLSGKYGNKFYWQQKGQAAAISNTVSAIDTCVREPIGKGQCSKIQGEFGEEPSSGPLGKFFFKS